MNPKLHFDDAGRLQYRMELYDSIREESAALSYAEKQALTAGHAMYASSGGRLYDGHGPHLLMINIPPSKHSLSRPRVHLAFTLQYHVMALLESDTLNPPPGMRTSVLP